MLVWKCDHWQCDAEAPAMPGDADPPDNWVNNRDGQFCSGECADEVGRENEGDRRYHEMKEEGDYYRDYEGELAFYRGE